jgi:hypothetical protein
MRAVARPDLMYSSGILSKGLNPGFEKLCLVNARSRLRGKGPEMEK